MISQDRAIEIARKEIKGKLEPQPNTPIKTELKNNQYIVTFINIWPPGTRGPSFAARVTIDAQSGKVLNAIGDAD